MCADFVRIAWREQEHCQISCIGLLEDVSRDGLCVNLEVPLTVGCTVHLHTRGFAGGARVRYCESRECGYLVGLEFLDGFGWDREKWRPKHLLADLERPARP